MKDNWERVASFGEREKKKGIEYRWNSSGTTEKRVVNRYFS